MRRWCNELLSLLNLPEYSVWSGARTRMFSAIPLHRRNRLVTLFVCTTLLRLLSDSFPHKASGSFCSKSQGIFSVCTTNFAELGTVHNVRVMGFTKTSHKLKTAKRIDSVYPLLDTNGQCSNVTKSCTSYYLLNLNLDSEFRNLNAELRTNRTC